MRNKIYFNVMIIVLLILDIQNSTASTIFFDDFSSDTTANYVKFNLQNDYSPPMVLSYAPEEQAIRFAGNEQSFWYSNQLSGVYDGTASVTVTFEHFGTLDNNQNGIGVCVGLRVNPDKNDWAHWGVWGGLYTYFGTQYAVIGDGATDYIGTPYSYIQGQTYDLKMVLLGSHAELYINGSKVFERNDISQPMSGLGTTAVWVADGASGSEASSFLVDNWQVVPEPATLLLIGLGGLALRGRK